ncbi:MAG: hypothetical protein M3428_05840 [Pseudomonadota bacterium]|nr:hypothetical protein [Pseudomonadota bacterium]
MDQRVLSVDEVTANYQQLDGKRITVKGMLAGCEHWPFVCRLDADDPRGNSLGFDSPDHIRRKLKGDGGREIVIEATFDAFCLGPFEERRTEETATFRVCLDAATDLKEPRILDIR